MFAPNNGFGTVTNTVYGAINNSAAIGDNSQNFVGGVTLTPTPSTSPTPPFSTG